MASSPRAHIEEIRRKKFSIGGGENNPLIEDLHQAVKNLSAELYAKDVHFLMEIIQNAEDNEYSEGVDPSLEFVITSMDITGTGAPATLLIFNNEIGFSPKNVESICSVGRSTKKGNRKKGYIGEKGIGFKSVFLITSRPYIFSNGYQIRFNEEPCQQCGLGYIVPEWVDHDPTLSDLKALYGSSSSSLPTTTLILPLKLDKVKPVRQQLSVLHPQVLLFLSKIKRLSVKEHGADPSLGSVNAIAITKETDFVQRKNIDAESFTLHLSADENGSGKECSFYMWRQKFVVAPRHRVDKRSEVDEWTISLAFPIGDPIQRGTSDSPGIYAFLPTEMVTNFPFIIQADFLLASSRETIQLDSKWNQGILDCVSVAFICAFKSLIKTNGDVPVWNLPRLFKFLPVKASNFKELNTVRESIRGKLVEEEIVPSEVLTDQKFFHKPRDVGRVMPSFWEVLSKAKSEGVSLLSICSHGKFVLASCFDRDEYDEILEFLGVQAMDNEWYSKCIQGSNLVDGVSEPVYLDLLLFVADHWASKFQSTSVKNIPLLKYEDLNGKKLLTSVAKLCQTSNSLVYLSQYSQHVSWLIDWNRELGTSLKRYFVPRVTQEAIDSSPRGDTLLQWLLNSANIGVVDVVDYADLLRGSLNQRNLVVSYVHFLYHSMSNKGFLSESQVDRLGTAMPLVDNYGNVVAKRSGVLVPAKGSKWAGLVASNLWRDEGFVELSEDYLSQFRFGGRLISSQNELLNFLRERVKAADVPLISPPNARIPSACAPLTKANTFLLLDWIRNHRNKGVRFPRNFLASVVEGSWLRIKLKGIPGCRPPSQSFFLNPSNSWGNLLQSGSVLVDIPLVDQSYYGNEIKNYIVELKAVGVKSEYSEACEFIGDRLMSLASSGNLTRENVISILGFIKFLRDECLSPKEFIASVKDGEWLRTCLGDKAPSECVLFEESWRIASQVSEIPFVDRAHYGRELGNYKTELELLGVKISFSASHQLVVDHLKPYSSLASLPRDAFLLLLECMRRTRSSDEVVRALVNTRCVKTKHGYDSPSGSLLRDPKWGCLLEVFDGLPLLDSSFYGERIHGFEDELKKLGVVVDFDQAVKAFASFFRDQASKRTVSKRNVVSLLSSYRKLKSSFTLPSDLNDCLREVKWLSTRHCDYYRSPKECILYSSEWESISPIARLPFIDDSDSLYGKAIHDYKKELKAIGVTVDLKQGVEFVESGLHFHDVKSITRENALALLECIRVLLERKSYNFPDDFVEKLSQPWLKTFTGYRPPKECLLFDPKFAETGLKKTDGPFLDDDFYSTKLCSYSDVLGTIGVVVEAGNGCSLIASQLESLTELSTIVRVYDYLARFNWEPKNDSETKIWIPNGNHKGRWARPEDCVVSDKSELFNSHLIALDKYYDKNFFFFSSALKVKQSPSTEDYCKLWKSWESSGRVLSHDECCKFFGFVASHWTSESEKTLHDEFAKMPVKSSANSEISLVNKCDVFIADDLQLKDLFEKSSSRSIFVWYPQPSLPSLSLTKLLRVFQSLGVRRISESVQREVSVPIGNEDQIVIPSRDLIKRGLVKLVLGFLASQVIGMEAKERHKAVGDLLILTVVETAKPIELSYNLKLSDESLNVKASRMVRWERESSKIFTQKPDIARGGPGYGIKRATYFSEAIAKGVLWENEEHINELTELLKTGFLVEFDEASVAFLMTSKNLQIFAEDEEFLSTVFST